MGEPVSPFRLAWLNLMRRRMPTAIAIISIAVSVATSGVLLRLYLLSGSRFSTMAHGGDAVIGAKTGSLNILLGSLNLEGKYPGFLPLKLYETLKQRRGVQFEDGARSVPTFLKGVIPFVYFGKMEGFRVIGTDESFFTRPESADNILFADGRWAKGSGEIVVGAEVAKRKSLKINDTTIVEGWIGDNAITSVQKSFRVVGLLARTDSVWDQALFSNLEEAGDTLKKIDLGNRSIWGGDVLNYFIVYLEPDGFSELEALINKRTIGEVVSIEGEKKLLSELTGTGQHLGLLITVLIMLEASFAVMAMMVTRFDAMTVQIAVLRALGFKKRDVASWLLWEGLLLGISASVIGAVLDALFFPMLRNILAETLPQTAPSLVFQSFPVWIGAITATTIAVAVPLIRIYGQDVHSSLKG
jgi:putative ABC transport system permease protein